MKRRLIVSAALLAAVVVAGCAGTPGASGQALASRAPASGPIVAGQSVPVTTFDTVEAQQALNALDKPPERIH